MKQQAVLESKRRGTPGFPMEYYYLHAAHPRYVMEPHWHPEMEFIRVIRGTFLAHLNNQPFPLTAGDILLVECGCLHRGEPQKGCEYDCVVFTFPTVSNDAYATVSRRLQVPASPDSGINRRITAADGVLHRAVSDFIDTVRAHAPFYETEAVGRLFHIVSLLYTDGTLTTNEAAPPPSRGAHTVMRVLERLDRDFCEEFSLPRVATEVGISEKYLCRLFREYTGKTMVEYLNERRVENACRAIAAGHSVTRAALDSGFNDLSYFCKLFKRYKGTTPSQYKKGVSR